MLIGTENSDFVRVIAPDVVGKTSQDPIVRMTAVGPIAMGYVRPWKEPVSNRINLAQAIAYPTHAEKPRKEVMKLESDLYWDLRKLFSVEHRIEEDYLKNVKDNKTLSREQAEAAAKVHESRQYIETEKKYEVGIPWKDSRRPVNNLWSAMRIFKGYVRNQGSKSEIIEKMMQTINEWLEAGYARLLTVKEAKDKKSFIIPSFVVTREDKTTTKHRLVINAAKEFDGKSLNDFISKTPDVMNQLYEVLLRFRKEKFSYTADIQHMFLQILTSPEDRKYLRVLYQPVRDGEIHVVECSRHMFGLRSSPFVAIEVIKLHARKEKDKWPKGSEAVMNSSIVDDVLTSVSTEEELLQLHKELKMLFSDMSMTIHKCASNSERMMSKIPTEQRAKQVCLDDISSENPELMPVIKALGMVYKPEDDQFRFEYNHEPPENWTLRSFVSAVAKLYDPLGLVAPFLMSGRAIVQVIWMSGRKWDEKVDGMTSKKCDLWIERAKELVELQIPRRITESCKWNSENGRLTVFSDACRIGYAAAAYWTENEQSRLVAARTRVAPTKKDESVQRLELAGCQLACEVAVEICGALDLDIRKVKFFTDSMTSLAWLRTTSRMSVYVSNRVCKVRDRTELDQWKYVPGKENPADIGSRGARPKTLITKRMWYEGPEFLREGTEPEQPELVEDHAVKQELISYENHLKKISLFSFLLPPMKITPFLIRFVKGRDLLQKSIRILTWVIVAVKKMRKEKMEFSDVFKEIWKGIINTMINEHQEEYWPEEMEELRNKGEAKTLKTLRPFLDQSGLMRMNSRLNGCWWLEYSSRNPFILHNRGDFVFLLVRHLHVERLNHYGGPSHLLSHLREKYWVTNPRQLVRRVISQCYQCSKGRRECTRPMMADLHPTRLGSGEDLRAFKEVGVDVSGPFYTKHFKVRKSSKATTEPNKRYLLIISCTVTRAVCLEMMYSGEASSCLMAMDRFVATYGRPTKVNSDSGTNLLKTKKEIQRRWEWWEETKRTSMGRYPMITWINNPPYSPNWGGHFERLIGIAKQTLNKILMNHIGVLSDEELCTLFKRVQSLMNNRPVTAVVQEDDSLLGLTPNCFLKTGGLRPLVPPTNPGDNLLKRYELLEGILKQYWKQFTIDYIPTLHKIEKWYRKEENLEVGDIVCVLQPGLPCGRWPLGRITRTYRARDGQVRVVEVETITNERKQKTKRSVSGLMPVLMQRGERK